MSFLDYKTSQKMLEELSINSSRYENVALSASLGRVLAEDIVAQYNDPKFPTASMDGYAVKFEDLDDETLKVLGDNPAGNDESRVIKSGECIKTFTGSKMPEGSDTLIQIENVTFKDNKITINEKVPFASSVRPVGESYKAGDVLIKKGTKIGFAQIGVMAGLNKVMVKVALKPRVAVCATGSEILDLGQESENSAQIRSSNNYTIAALCQSVGADVVQLGTVGDDKDKITEIFKNALSSSDILISTGGVSVGDYDFVKDIVPALGAKVIFKGVGIKPGRHIMLAQMGEKFILALPGFAYSSTVTAILYGLPLIANMLDSKKPYTIVKAKLDEDFKKRSKFTEFSACNLTVRDNEYFIDFNSKKVGSSAILTNLLDNSALMISSPDDNLIKKDSIVDVIVLEDF
jgi:molybdopterin molybdotransferase